MMFKWKWSCLVLILMLITECHMDSDDDDSSFACHTLSRNNFTCGECIKLHPDCAWCSMKDFSDDQFSRCDTTRRLKEHFCEKEFIEAPLSSEPILTKNLSLTGTVTSEGQDKSDPIQLQPQSVRLHLRPHDPVSFTLRYQQAVEYPVDLYYLMDLTDTMKDDKEKLVEVAEELAGYMRSVSGNFRLGFGSFVDKEVQPFIETDPKRSHKYCAACVPPYDFQNHLSLSYDIGEFVKKVDEAKTSFSLDGPESGLDALLQATVCKNDIGWRDRARKIILYASDSLFHVAGDGRIAGLVEPNDGRCHLGPDGRTNETRFDYPSVARLRRSLVDHKTNVLFAVTKSRVELFNKLVEQMGKNDITITVSELAEGSENIVPLLQSEYQKIARIVTITDNSSRTEDVNIKYFAVCKDGKEILGSTCRDIAVGEEIQFRVEVEYIGRSAKPITIAIGPVGIDELMTVQIVPIIDCNCEDPKYPCLGYGNLSCGVCLCKSPFKGRHCDCEKPEYSNEQLDAQCRKGSDLRTPLCEGRGICECGQCQCKPRLNPNEIVSGQYCECDNFNCPRTNRQICAGHGRCVCSGCQCDSGWTGVSCDCPIGQESCVGENKLICSGRGYCDCGVCSCGRSPDGFRYSGPTCELCPTCPDKCEEFRPCVMCRQFKTGPFDDAKCQSCISAENYQTVKEIEDILTPGITTCQFVDPKDDCSFSFAYLYDLSARQMLIWAKEKKTCPQPVSVLAIVLSVIGGIVGIGVLLLIIWRLIATWYDRQEYMRFLKESEDAKFSENENPLFRPPMTTFENPLQQQKKRQYVTSTMD